MPIRRVVLGPFVLGGGMLVAALGGSLAVAAAATVITASAIGSDDLPARPGHAVAPSASQHAASSGKSVAARRSAAPHRPASPTTGRQSQIPPPAGLLTSPGAAGGGSVPGVAGAPALSSVARQLATTPATSRAGSPSASAPAGSPSLTPTPSPSGPLGNAVIHVSGFDQSSGRLAYQFATVKPRAAADGGDLYLISDSQTFTAALAPSAVVISGGSICPPAGSTCTLDQLIRAADAGFFAQAAIDATGVLRSIIEVGDQPIAAAKLPPVPSASATQDNSRWQRSSSSSPSPSATS
ncbi:MAG TPA: hypothetical protein VGB75_08570 [Jatrophihabitans sp.]|jgi:hypothetical protein|uniref:hypothetical protein n=1 Tax=Jatrophihabitans sp. TaxID=1932789 RepID=UPI002EF63990